MTSRVFELAGKGGHIPRPWELAEREKQRTERKIRDEVKVMSPMLGAIANGAMPVGPNEEEVVRDVLEKLYGQIGG